MEPYDASLLHHAPARRSLSTMASPQGHGANIASSSVHVGPSLSHLPSDPILFDGSGLYYAAQPGFNRPAGRPRQNRIKGALDYFDKKKPMKNSKSDKDGKKRKIRCGDCDMFGHSAKNCKKKHVDIYSEIPEF
ncbi:unnamed protein product [Urochloa humidicola]